MNSVRPGSAADQRISADLARSANRDVQADAVATAPARADDDRLLTDQHWPHLSPGAGQRPSAAPSALVLWAESFPDLPRCARALLIMLAREASSDRTARISLPHLARALAIGRNTCRRHLDLLMSSGFVMIRNWSHRTSGCLLGYELRLIVDVGDRPVAAADGFRSSRGQDA